MSQIRSWDSRRNYFVASCPEEAIEFAASHWEDSAKKSVITQGHFHVALSGGSSPAPIFDKITKNSSLPWEDIWLFWGDEREGPLTSVDSNYKMAMDHGFSKTPIPLDQIFPMQTEGDLPLQAERYEKILRTHLTSSLFDLVMLGVGTDGHTASLFPNTQALVCQDRLVIANEVPQKKTWRMTLSFPCINQSKLAVFYAYGPEKRHIVQQVLQAPHLCQYPASHIGTQEHKALWILDFDPLSRQ